MRSPQAGSPAALRTPLGINTAVGALVVVVCCIAPPHLDAADMDARLAVLALGLAAFSAAVVDVVAAAATVGVAFLLFDGFAVGHEGDLVWHGEADLVRIVVLAGAALLGYVAGSLHERVARHGRTTAIGATVPGPRSLPDPTELVSSGQVIENPPEDGDRPRVSA